MGEAIRRPRADAERNRRRLLDAAAELFGERGLEVGVAEIARRAGIGRGTLFRNFPTKDDLIAAIVVEQMTEAAAWGRDLLGEDDAGAALFGFLEEAVRRQQRSRALFEAVQDSFLANSEIRAAHAEVVDVLGKLLSRAQAADAVRGDITAIDVLLLLKGACEAAAAFQRIDPEIAGRQLDLIRAAINPINAQALRGRSPTLEDMFEAVGEPADAATGDARASA
ncbi:MAG TPA: helix-turn-helix domain-containing protein [Solirubrobacteraceae bacterium]|jgi:AcrR family transcriptional regulator